MNDKPNILLITADQFRWDCLGSMGNRVIHTPHLDALASRGLLFRNGFTPNPICVPARASIMTGNYPHICTSQKTNGGRIKENQPLLTDVLKSVGYRTYAMGKLHFVPYAPPNQPRLVHGFDHVDLTESGRIIGQYDPQGKLAGLEDYFDYLKTVGWQGYTRAHGTGNNDVRPCPSPLPVEHYVDHWIADCTIKQIDHHLHTFNDKPFFMWMSSPKPHSPYDPPRPYDMLHDPREMSMPFGSVTDLTTRNPFLDYVRYTHALPSISPEAWQVIRSYYYGNITFLDAMIGRVMHHLAQSRQLDRTLVLFTADHGDLLGDFGTSFKSNHLNGSVRIPFIAAGPGVKAGGSSEALVGLQDILPTFASLAGAEIDQSVQGKNICTILQEPKNHVRDEFYSETATGHLGQSLMVTNGKWKYIYSEAGATEELYDQETDLQELHNFAGNSEYDGVLDEMRMLLKKKALELGDDSFLNDKGFKAIEVNREEFSNAKVSGMGWRWY